MIVHPFNPLKSAHGKGAHDSRLRLVKYIYSNHEFKIADLPDVVSRGTKHRMAREAIADDCLIRQDKYELTDRGFQHIIGGTEALYFSLKMYFIRNDVSADVAGREAEARLRELEAPAADAVTDGYDGPAMRRDARRAERLL